MLPTFDYAWIDRASNAFYCPSCQFLWPWNAQYQVLGHVHWLPSFGGTPLSFLYRLTFLFPVDIKETHPHPWLKLLIYTHSFNLSLQFILFLCCQDLYIIFAIWHSYFDVSKNFATHSTYLKLNTLDHSLQTWSPPSD